MTSVDALSPNPLPPLSTEVFAALKTSIAAHGLLVPVVVSAGPALAGVVADGHHRLRACQELGLVCPRELRPFASEAELRVFQLQANITRRHLSVAQRIRLGLELEPWERQLAGQRRAQAKGERRGAKTVPVGLPEEKGATRERVARAVGLGASTYERGANVLRHGSPQLVVDFEQGRETVNSAYQRLRSQQRRDEINQLAEQLRAQPPQLPQGRFAVIVCDPPWPYQRSTLPYPTLSLEEIAALPIERLATQDCLLWLWTTNAFLPQALPLLAGWGFEYKTTLTWAKDRIGTGSLLRGQTEHCLLSSRGKPLVTLTSESTLLHGPVREHSRKPAEFYALVEALCPGSKLDLFARQHHPGWTGWGAETSKFKEPGRAA